MIKNAAIYRKRVQKYLNEVIVNAIYGSQTPVNIAVFQCADPIPYAEAVTKAFTPVSLGFRFGPKWSTAWFKITGTVPPQFAGQKVVLRFRSETEGLVYKDGAPAQGMERNHDDYVLYESAVGGEEFELFIECGVNTFFGANGGSRSESRQPVNHHDSPGHLHTCALAVLNDNVRSLFWDFAFLANLEEHLPASTPRAGQLLRALNDAVNAIDPTDVAGTADGARQILAAQLSVPAAGSASHTYGTGHAHIDLAWLWPLRETIRKGSRTFSTQVALMKEYPDYTFQSSQAQLTAWVKQHYPALFAEIKEMVAAGQWEPGGAMWVEADCNIPSGESLVRQILHGRNFWKQEFDVEQTYLWLPDVFGYSAALPQILRLAGLQYFVTQKISWNQFNRFPHHTFNWEGIDGTSIFSHFLPADTYNGENTPQELMHGEDRNQDTDRANHWLQAFGYGDGGGGPTRQHIEFLRRAENCDGLPRAHFSRVDDFLEKLESESTDLATWVGELYLEYHRGTYTNQAKNKLANRLGEMALREAELLAALAPTGSYSYPALQLDTTWKLMLLQQFHDIIPGSSITWVYEDSADHYAQILGTARDIIAAARQAWLKSVDTSKAKNPLVVFNALSWSGDDVVTVPAAALPAGLEVRSLQGANRTVSPAQKIDTADGAAYLVRAVDVPALGFQVFDLSAQPPSPSVKTGAASAALNNGVAVLENARLRAEFDKLGRLTRLYDKTAKREVVDGTSPANQFVLYEDRPNDYNAWDVDVFYLEKASPVETQCAIKIVENGPVRATIEVTRKLGRASSMTQRISLTMGSPRLDFETDADWHEDQTFLRVLNPVNVHSPRATFEIQFGHVERPTHMNTSWDVARFEVCAQKWADLSEPGYGVAILNNGKYGHSVHGNVIGLSLLRASISPDPTSDRGQHHFTYSLMPHEADLRDAGVIEQAYRLNSAMTAQVETAHTGELGASHSAIACDSANVVIESIKKAENSDDIIIRVYESFGRRNQATLKLNFAFESAQAVDLLERPTDLYEIKTDGSSIRLNLTPFAIRTIAVKRAKS